MLLNPSNEFLFPKFSNDSGLTWTSSLKSLWLDSQARFSSESLSFEKDPIEGPLFRNRQIALASVFLEEENSFHIKSKIDDAIEQGVLKSSLIEKAIFLERFDVIKSLNQKAGESWDDWLRNPQENLSIFLTNYAFFSKVQKACSSEHFLKSSQDEFKDLDRNPRWIDLMVRSEKLSNSLISEKNWSGYEITHQNENMIKNLLFESNKSIQVLIEGASPTEHLSFLNLTLFHATFILSEAISRSVGQDKKEKEDYLVRVIDKLIQKGASLDAFLSDPKKRLNEKLPSVFNLLFILSTEKVESTLKDKISSWIDLSKPESWPESNLFENIFFMIAKMPISDSSRRWVSDFSRLSDLKSEPPQRTRSSKLLNICSKTKTDWLLTSFSMEVDPPQSFSLEEFCERALTDWEPQFSNLKKSKPSHRKDLISKVIFEDFKSHRNPLQIAGVPIHLIGTFLNEEDKKKWDQLVTEVNVVWEEVKTDPCGEGFEKVQLLLSLKDNRPLSSDRPKNRI